MANRGMVRLSVRYVLGLAVGLVLGCQTPPPQQVAPHRIYVDSVMCEYDMAPVDRLPMREIRALQHDCRKQHDIW